MYNLNLNETSIVVEKPKVRIIRIKSGQLGFVETQSNYMSCNISLQTAMRNKAVTARLYRSRACKCIYIGSYCTLEAPTQSKHFRQTSKHDKKPSCGEMAVSLLSRPARFNSNPSQTLIVAKFSHFVIGLLQSGQFWYNLPISYTIFQN